MQLIGLNINKSLFLKDHLFDDNSNNIEYLNNAASNEADLEQKLFLLNKATQKIEKFHSFFHYEQSYFHLQLAIYYLQNNKESEAKEQLENAIFQDHLNKQAKALLSKESFLEKNNYNRVYKDFSQYINFATEGTAQIIIEIPAGSYWDLWHNKIHDQESLTQIIQMIREQHLNYHIEAAKLYLNRAMIFQQLNHIDLAKNDLVKAYNLDNMVRSREYYPHP